MDYPVSLQKEHAVMPYMYNFWHFVLLVIRIWMICTIDGQHKVIVGSDTHQGVFEKQEKPQVIKKNKVIYIQTPGYHRLPTLQSQPKLSAWAWYIK